MSAFACVASTGTPIGPDEAVRRLQNLPAPVAIKRIVAEDGFAAAAGAPFLRPLVARRNHLTAVGDARLDNRAEIARLASSPIDRNASDLDVVLAAFEARGEACVPALLGDFGFAVWDARTRTLTAARDAFGVKPLFYAESRGLLVVANRLEAVRTEDVFDEAFVADFLVGGGRDLDRTIWAGCRAVPPGGLLVHRDGMTRISRFWRADDFAPADHADERESAERFRALFAEAVRSRLTGGADAWSQLSGGLDSSSVVSMAQWLAESGEVDFGLGGTVTVVDSLGDGDETRFSGAVTRRWSVRNETVADPWPWEDDGASPTATDEPRPHFPFWTRDRRICDVVRRGGARVLLSGQGADHYLDGPLTFTADLLARGRIRDGLAEVARHAVAQRQSFWSGLKHDALMPLLPVALQARLSPEPAPEWIDASFARRVALAERMRARRGVGAPPGRLWPAWVARSMERIAHFVERGPYAEGLEMRYPFLHRPLVEFGLALPVAQRIRPGVSKWVLREGMRGILPEEVRTRRGKGGIDARVLWALQREAARISELLRDPLVAQMGWVRGDALREAADRARCGQVESLSYLLCALSLETWLVVRSGRWNPRREAIAITAA
jgi:asparagine synthase (glutamine-hydrolysing)